MYPELKQRTTNLGSFQNKGFERGAPRWKEWLWLIINGLFFINPLSVVSRVKVFWLRVFGAEVGKGVMIKPGVNIKFPWKLSIGNHCWIGENVWIDNLAQVRIQDHVCLSQGAFLLCGNHDYTKTSFDLITKPIVLETGVWIGAKAVVCPGVTCASHAVLAVGSVATKDLEAYAIYQGNPAVKVRERRIVA
ncbi:MAG: WcaF family extracellular polysaccharide biosynthesis acetyltransferase [Saprospiraceae bacterium]